MLALEIKTEGSFPLAKLRGDFLSGDVDHVTDTLIQYVTGDSAKLAVDLSELEAIDSSGLGALISLVTRSRLGNGRVVLVGPRPLIRGVLEVTRLDSWFEVVATLDEAASRFAEN